MRKKRLALGLFFMLFFGGCAAKEPPLPPVPAMPADLSRDDDAWSAAEQVELPPPEKEPAPPQTRPPAPNETLYAYEPQTEYVVLVPLGWPADIALEPGELVHAVVTGDRSYLAEGEEPRWDIKEGISESEYTPRAHIFLTATHAGLRQGIVVTTSRRTYHLTVKSVQKTPVRTVRWTYPPAPIKPVKREPSLLPDETERKRYHIGYEIHSPQPAPDFLPTWIGDDGKKTYLAFSPVILYEDAPLLRLRGPNGFEVVNVRMVRNVYVIDRLISHAELRYGTGKQAQVVTITRGHLTTIQCPGHAACPKWPSGNDDKTASKEELP